MPVVFKNIAVKNSGLATVSQLREFEEIVDVRTPSEFAEDHVPGALNCPVMSDEERARVGTLYKQHSPFEAKKVGAALVARNIAFHIENRWLHKPKSWHPLIYCWRGGQRSGAMTHILRQIGFAAEKLDGGYKSYRHHVLQQLNALPPSFSFRVLCGLTGSGKSRLLAALRQSGAQVLDLEGIARHRGSVLGDMPETAQPAQKNFDSQVLEKLESFDPATPVYVESESKRIGQLRVPDELIAAMWESPCLRLEAAAYLRVALLREDYAHFLRDPALLHQQLERLKGLYPGELLEHWRLLCEARKWDEFIAELLDRHYDPAYDKSMCGHYRHYDEAHHLTLNALSEKDFRALADEVLALSGKFINNGGNA
ncbi:MAG: selenophosphate-dependent tRNA 2-selenouridine synthase [Gallionellaceae bacterium]|nr:MAG: selenophosphate-dependent tRNA 2-selenouridine synthase [Gallionellaceae bacterium]